MFPYQQEAMKRFSRCAATGRIQGEGRYVLGSRCGSPIVILFKTERKRAKKREVWDRNGCGENNCTDAHDLFDLDEVK